LALSVFCDPVDLYIISFLAQSSFLISGFLSLLFLPYTLLYMTGSSSCGEARSPASNQSLQERSSKQDAVGSS
jgi:hypothetical protein